MAEEIVRITGIKGKPENTASTGIGNAEFSDFVKTYEQKHQAMMNLVASTSANASSIFNSILKTVNAVANKQIDYGNLVLSALSTNNALAQTAAEAITQGVSKVSSSLDVIGNLILDLATPNVNPDEELAKQILNKLIIDNKSYISKWKFDELDAMMHPSKAKKAAVAPVPQASAGSSVAAEIYAKLDEFYTMFDVYTDDVARQHKVTLRTIQDIYTLGDIETDHTVDITTSMSRYIQDTYTLLDLYTDSQVKFNKQVLLHLGSIDQRLEAAKEIVKQDNSSHVNHQNAQKFDINNKQTNIGIDKSIKTNYTGNIDVRAIKELLESNAIFNPAKTAMVRMMHPSKAKKAAAAPVPQTSVGSSVVTEIYAKLNEFYTMFDVYTDDVERQNKVTLRTIQDIYTLGDLKTNHTVVVTTSMSQYIKDTYTLLDLYTDSQVEFNKQVLLHLGSIDQRLEAAKEIGKQDNSSHVNQQNAQKFGINNKQTNIGIDKSIKMNYTGNIDVRAIKELLESNAIFNPAKTAMVRMMFKSVAKSIADGLTDIRAVLQPKKLGTDDGKDIFDDPIKSIEASTALIQTISQLASLSGNTITKNSNLGIFGTTILNVQNQTKLIGKGNTKKLSVFFKTISKSIADGFAEIQKVAPSQHTIMAVQKISEMISAISALIQPRSRETSFELFGKDIFSFSRPQNLDKEIDKFRKTFKNLTDVFVDLYDDLSGIKIHRDKIEGISDTIKSLTQVISRNTISFRDAMGFRILGAGLSSIFRSITNAEVDKEKGKEIADILGWILPIVSPNKISPKDGIGLVIASTGIGNFFSNLNKVKVDLNIAENVALTLDNILSLLSKYKISPKDGISLTSVGLGVSAFFKSISGTKVDLKTAENISLSLDAILESINNNKLSMKDGIALVSLAGGLSVLSLAISAVGKADKAIDRGASVFVNFADKLAEKFSTRRVRRTVSSIKMLATGIATLGLAIAAFAVISPLAVVAAGALALFGLAVSKTVASKKTSVGLALFTTSLAMLGVSLWAFSEVAAEYLPSVIGGLAILGGAIWLLGNGGKFGGMSLTGKPPYKVLGYLAAGLATLGLAIWAWQELGLTGKGTLLVAGGIAMLTAATWGMSKIDNSKTQASFLMMSLGVVALGGAIWVWQKAHITWDSMAIVAAGIGSLALVMRFVSSVPITAGANMLLMATGVAALGGAIWVWTKSGVTWEIMGMIGVGIAGLAVAAYALGNPMALMGAATMTVLGVGLVAISGAMAIIAKTEITTDKAINFTKSLGIVVLGLAALALPAVPAVATSVMLLPVAVSSLAMAGIFALLSNININQDRIKIFGKSINILVDAYDDLGLAKTGKAAIKAVACIPIATSSIATATAIRIVQMLNLDQDRISQNADAMGIFLIKMTDVFSNVGPRIEKVKNGVAAVGNLANVIKSLADAVLTVSKMEYPENKIVDGKIVPVALRKLTDKDFENVGVGIGKMLNALIDPLITIGSSKETYTIGGFTIQNPFGSGNKVKKGINALKGIGEIFTPLANVVKSITETGALGKDGQDAAKKLQTIIGSLLKSIGDTMTSLGGIEFEDSKDLKRAIEGMSIIFDPISKLMKSLSETGILSDDNKEGSTKLKFTMVSISDTIISVVTRLSGISGETGKLESVTKNLSDMFSTISKADASGITKIREEVDKIYEKLSNVKPWNTFRLNLREYTKSAGQIVTHINGMDLEKAVILSTMVKDLKDADENGNIERLIEQIKELIGQMADNQQKMQQLQETTNNIINNTTNTTAPVQSGGKQSAVPQHVHEQQQSNDGAILAELRRIVSKLNSKLIVAQSPADTWNVRSR